MWSEDDDGAPSAARVLLAAEAEAADVLLAPQPCMDASAQPAGTEAVDDADLAHACEGSSVEELIEAVEGLVNAEAEEVDFRCCRSLGPRPLDGHGGGASGGLLGAAVQF